MVPTVWASDKGFVGGTKNNTVASVRETGRAAPRVVKQQVVGSGPEDLIKIDIDVDGARAALCVLRRASTSEPLTRILAR